VAKISKIDRKSLMYLKNIKNKQLIYFKSARRAGQAEIDLAGGWPINISIKEIASIPVTSVIYLQK